MATLLSDEIGPLRERLELLARENMRIWPDLRGWVGPRIIRQPGEEWRRYSSVIQVSSLGRVARDYQIVEPQEAPSGWDHKRDRERKPTHMRCCSFKVHVAVAAVFIGPRPPGLLVLHNNGDFRDNRAVNLRYGTAKDNYEDAVLHGTRKRRAPSVGGWPAS